MKKLLYALLATIALVGVFGYIVIDSKIDKLEVKTETKVSAINEFLGLEDQLGYSVNTAFQVALSQSLTSSATTINISSSKLFNGEEFTPSYPVYLMVNSGGSNAEIVECWGMTTSTSANSFTSCNRGLSFSGNSSTSTITTNQKAHAAGEKIAQTNVHYTLDQYFDRWASENILGTTSTFINTKLSGYMAFGSTSTQDGTIKNIGGFMGWSEPGAAASTFLFNAGGSGLTASSTLGINISSSKIGIDTSSLTNNYVNLGSYGNAFKNVYASGTIYSSFSTSTWDGITLGNSTRGAGYFTTLSINGNGATSTNIEVTGSGTSTLLTGVAQSNSANTSTFAKLWTDIIGNRAGSGTTTITNNLQVNGNIDWTGELKNTYISSDSDTTARIINIASPAGARVANLDIHCDATGAGTEEGIDSMTIIKNNANIHYDKWIAQNAVDTLNGEIIRVMWHATSSEITGNITDIATICDTTQTINAYFFK